MYKAIYFNRREGQLNNRKKKKAKILFRIIINALLLIIQVFLILNLTLSWIIETKRVETTQLDFYVHNSNVKTFINVNFNSAESYDYTNDEITFTKIIIPGDVIDLSVYIDLTETVNFTHIDIIVQNVPNWLLYLDLNESTKLWYADKTSETLENGNSYITLHKSVCDATVPAPEETPVDEDFYDLTFRIRIPDDYASYEGLCLDFKLLFEDNNDNQNFLMEKEIRLRFMALEVQS